MTDQITIISVAFLENIKKVVAPESSQPLPSPRKSGSFDCDLVGVGRKTDRDSLLITVDCTLASAQDQINLVWINKSIKSVNPKWEGELPKVDPFGKCLSWEASEIYVPR